ELEPEDREDGLGQHRRQAADEADPGLHEVPSKHGRGRVVPMLSPGEAFLLAYLPSRHATLLARKALLERLSPTLDPKLRHAVDFHREALGIYTSIIARTTTRLVELAAHASIVLPAMPPPPDGWRATLAKDAQRLMALPDLQIAWEAGEIAGDIHRSAELLADLAYLRAAAPETPELRGEAEQA